MPPIYDNSMRALALGPSTNLEDQPPYPSHGTIRTRRRVLFGAQLPSSSAGNAFVDLYSDDGRRMTFTSVDDFQRVAGNPPDVPADWGPVMPFPQTIELNEPWSIGAPGQQRGIHFALALGYQLMPDLSPTSVLPGAGVRACGFSTLCRRNTPEYSVAHATDRALREQGTVPIFKSPRLFMVPSKQEEGQQADGRVMQAWFPWQVCTNCLAVRGVGRCSLWATALSVQQPMAMLTLPPGEQSHLDRSYGWFTRQVRDGLQAKDVGYTGPWLCRDGQVRNMAQE